MSLTDKILSFLALATFIGFLIILGSFVVEPDLLIVLAIGALLAIYDFWLRPLFMPANGR